MALGFTSVVELQQHGVKYLEDEIVERHCMEAVQLLVLLWIVHCFEKTEAGQWLQHCPIFYAELFGNSNPRQIIQNLYKTELNNIQMILLTDTLRIRVELLDCSCSDLDAEQSKLPQCLVPQHTEREITSRPILTFLKFNRNNFLYPLLFLGLSIRHSQEFFHDLENVFLQNFSNHHVEIIRKKFPNNKDESDRSIEGNEGARNYSCRSVICVVMYLGEIITTLLC
ncbi:unnamed protein product [Brugia timori]|uniref:E3 ubiquitin-protein ligase n=1 Tax=Brugia timori TaxID=42155 RepID=A0A0R3QYK3_9BILA|nr:unnamed protein product [Brugia timori]